MLLASSGVVCTKGRRYVGVDYSFRLCADMPRRGQASIFRNRKASPCPPVEGPPCQAPAEIVPAPTYRPTYKPSLRGSDDDDCIDDEDWSYTTKEGDVFTCERVAEKTKRCTIRFSEDGVRADDACKKTCGTC